MSIPKQPPNLFTALARGFRRRCPKCGQGSLFEALYRLRERCEVCGCAFRSREPDTYFLMYMSTAAFTGVIVIGMFLIEPQNKLVGRIVVALLAVLLMFGTLPFRKGMAIGWEIYLESRGA